MPAGMLVMDLSFKSSKQSLKEWIKHRVPPWGDKVLWGKPLGEAGAPRDGPGGQGGGEDEEQPGGPGLNREDEATATEQGLQAPQGSQQELLGVEEPRGGLVGEELHVPELAVRKGGLLCGNHLQAGHQLCPPRRRHSPKRGLRDTTGCPRWRAARHQVTHKDHVRLLTLTK